jgi:hypothetical protein
MTPLTCHQAEDLIDLFAADACDPDQAESLSAHLATCPTCTASLEQARNMVAMLDWQAREPEARERLRDAIEAEARPRVSRAWQPAVWQRRLASLAALLLVVLGLSLGLGGASDPEGPVVSFMTLTPRVADIVPGGPMEMVQARTAKEHDDSRHIKFTAPPAIDVSLDVRNDTGRPARFHLAGRKTLLELDVAGPGKPRGEPTLLPAGEVEARPGETTQITLHGFAVTRPGDYRLQGRLRVEAVFPATPIDAERRGPLWLTLPPVRVHVPAPAP